MSAPFLKRTGLLLGVLLSACGDKPPPPSPEPEGPSLDIQAAQAVWPAGAPGDFDGDGHLDLLGAHRDGLLLSRGRGDGTFAEQELQNLGTFTAPTAVGDLDKDGDLDLVSANTNARLVRVLLNDGTGRFAETELSLTLAEFEEEVAITLADVDADGALDVVMMQPRSNLLTVWRTAGTGRLGTRVDLPTRTSLGPGAVAATDLDGDSRPELLVAHTGSAPLEVFQVRGFSGGADPVREEVPVGPCESFVNLAVGDFDKDTDTDVALSCQGLVILRNDGQAHLTPTQQLPSAGATQRVAAGDVDRDGALDLVLSDHDHGPTLFKGVGDGTFRFQGAWVTRVDSDGMRQPVHLVDVDEDGQLDLLSGTTSAFNNYALLRGDSQGGFSGPRLELMESREQVHALVDISGDGVPDVLARGKVFINGPEGTFPSTPTDFQGGSVLAVDVNGDGKNDVVAVSSGIATLWLSDGRTLVHPATLGWVGGGPSGLRDIDHDGVADLDFWLVYAKGLGEGRFATVTDVPLDYTYGSRRISGGMVYADHNRDGELDLYSTDSYTLSCRPSGYCDMLYHGPAIFLWNGRTRRYELLAVRPPLKASLVTDLTGDGIPDLATSEQFARGFGNGTFDAPEPHPPRSTLEKLRLGLWVPPVAGDVNGDGVTDVLEFRGEWLDVKLGQEDGELAPPVTAFAPGFVRGFVPGLYPSSQLVDVDDDGLPELVTPMELGMAVLKLATR